MDGGWAFSLSGLRQWGRDSHIEGVYADNWSLNASLAKKLNPRNHLAFIFIAAPTEQGVKGAATKEAFELTSNNMYNPYWGYQNGKVRNSRVRGSTPLLFIGTWSYDTHDKLRVNTSVAFISDKNSYSSLDWYDAANPMPDYYRYMPSYYSNPSTAEDIRQEWTTGDGSITRINWGDLYEANRSSSLPASYIVKSRVSEMTKLQLAGTFGYDIKPDMELTGGIRAKYDQSLNYGRLDDLLGAEYILDIDQYLVDDEYFGDKLENNISEKGKHITKGEKFGYNYDMLHQSYEGWAVMHFGNTARNKNLTGYAGVQAGVTGFQREGYFEKELFPGGMSSGMSPRTDFTTYTVKGGITYNFNPSHHIGMNAVYGDIAPSARNIFISPDYQNAIIDDPRTINVLGGEFNYRYSNRLIDLHISAYATQTTGETDVIHFYDDISTLYSNLVIKDVEKLFMGAEIGAAVSITSGLTLKAAAAISNNRYSNNPSAKQTGDKNSEIITDNEPVYIKAYRLGGSPQRVASGELSYSNRLWFASVSVNYAGDNYIEMNPLRRTRRVCDHASSPEAVALLTMQERLPDATTVNLFLSKGFRIGKHYLSISGSINNLADKKNIVHSGYEQMRLAKSGTGLYRTITPFGSKYYYAYGRTYYLTANFRF